MSAFFLPLICYSDLSNNRQLHTALYCKSPVPHKTEPGFPSLLFPLSAFAQRPHLFQGYGVFLYQSESQSVSPESHLSKSELKSSSSSS